MHSADESEENDSITAQMRTQDTLNFQMSKDSAAALPSSSDAAAGDTGPRGVGGVVNSPTPAPAALDETFVELFVGLLAFFNAELSTTCSSTSGTPIRGGTAPRPLMQSYPQHGPLAK